MSFGEITSGIFTDCDSFAITVWAVFESIQVDGHESYDFVFARFVLTVTFDGVLHNVSLTCIYNVLAVKRVDKRNPPKRVLNFCYEVCLTLGYFTRPMRTVSRLRLLLCLIYGHRLPSAITPTLCPVETMQARHKHSC